MAEGKRKKRSKVDEVDDISKTDEKIAKYIRWYTPKKDTTIQRQQVDYFVGSKAVDTLLDSKWGSKCKGDALFKSREDCVRFIQKMIDSKMFYRGDKVLKEEKVKEDSKKKSGDEMETKVVKRKKADETGDSKKVDEKKKKRKYIINYHDQQVFVDSNDIYVWVFDPVQPKKMFFGVLIVLGVVGATMFPLWPPQLRVGVYYLSVACGCFVAAVLLTGLLRSIFFFIVWLVTLGKYHVWFLPNLLADVGFFESFKPVYTIDYHGEDDEEGEDDDVADETTSADCSDNAEESNEVAAAAADGEARNSCDEGNEEDGGGDTTSSEFEIINDEATAAAGVDTNKKDD